MSSQLICPLCEECLEEEGIHFLRHFKYKQYPCHEDSCPLEFYTEADRNEHIKKSGHKRSFQKHINPYISKLVAMVASDARALATSSLDTVLDNRFGVDPDISVISTPKPTPAEPSTSGGIPKKRSLADKTPSVIVKKKSTSSVTQKEKEANARVVEETPRRPPGITSSSKTSKDTPSSSSRPAASAEVDSTTNDQPGPSSSTASQKKTKKKRIVSELAPPLDINDKSYDQMSAAEKLAGFYDPNVPARRNAAKVVCADCKEEIIYDYILRKDHVSSRHMAADVAPEDYEDILKAAMDSAFPDLPNTNLACQLCMTAQDIARNRRREHIENQHTNSLPELECPFLGCGKGYRRQCDLSGHMKDSHKSEMCKYKDAAFQKVRRHRNFMINEVLKKCFPWSELEILEKTEKKVSESSVDRPNRERPRTDSEQGLQPLADYSLNNDIRVLERSTNKTRRPPQYNFNGSSSDSSDDDEVQPDYTQEIIFIRECCNSEIAAKLSQRSVQVKTEPVEQPEEEVRGSDVFLNEPMDLVEDVKEEMSVEDKKIESISQPIDYNSFAPIMGYNIPQPPPEEFPQIQRSPFPETYGREQRQDNDYRSSRQEIHGYRPDSIRPASHGRHYDRPPPSSSSSQYNRNTNHHNSYHPNRSGPSSRYQSNPIHTRIVMPPRNRSPLYRRSSRGRDRSRSRPRHNRRNN